MREKFAHTYTIFAGGDDLFLVGAWDEIVALAHEIRTEFKNFVKNDELTISFGIAIAKANTPISYLASICEHLLESSKAVEGKDAITLFGESVKWAQYLQTHKNLNAKFQNLKDDESFNTAFLYRLLEFCDMSKKVKFESDWTATMWKSKLKYAIARNQSDKFDEIYATLDEEIENNPKESKMVISQIVYQRRKR